MSRPKEGSNKKLTGYMSPLGTWAFSIGTGIAVYDPSRHLSLISVFEEADSAMYEKERIIKVTGQQVYEVL